MCKKFVLKTILGFSSSQQKSSGGSLFAQVKIKIASGKQNQSAYQNECETISKILQLS